MKKAFSHIYLSHGKIMRIAIMQPYFIPYAGYFRLFLAADLFVIFDCVQFPRRGWVHRNRLPNSEGSLQWLTLPLKKAPQAVLIKDLIFFEGYQRAWEERLLAFPQFAKKMQGHELNELIYKLKPNPIDHIVYLLQSVCKILGFPFNVIRSSSFNLPTEIKGEERIIEIAHLLNAKEYINLAGGKELYNHEHFKRRNLKLSFLADYQGPMASILHRLIIDNPAKLSHEIISQVQTS